MRGVVVVVIVVVVLLVGSFVFALLAAIVLLVVLLLWVKGRLSPLSHSLLGWIFDPFALLASQFVCRNKTKEENPRGRKDFFYCFCSKKREGCGWMLEWICICG